MVLRLDIVIFILYKLIKQGLQVVKVGGFGGHITITTGTNKRKSACIIRIKIKSKMISEKVCKFVLDSR